VPDFKNKTRRPKLFSPSVSRQESKIAVPSKVMISQMENTNIASTSSFRYDIAGSPLKSTQEISLDWSKFENHTFFNSAESKVNIAFQKIINEYPFDGTLKQIEAFEDSLTGYEKYVLKLFPKYSGFLHFSGTTKSENPAGGHSAKLGTYVSVEDKSGAKFPNFSKIKTLAPALSFGNNSFSFEFLVYPEGISNLNQILYQKRANKDKAITIALSQSSSKTKCNLLFSVNSGSNAQLFTSCSIEKGKFSHICATFDRNPGENKLKIYVSESLRVTSSFSFEMDTLSFSNSSLIIGSGSSFTVPSWSTPHGEKQFTPKTTFSGSIDELRVFHEIRTEIQQKRNATRGIYASDNLKLYYKFNEPTGSYRGLQNVLLDSSGNSLHSRISNYVEALRITGSISNPMKNESLDRNPVIFPTYNKVLQLNLSLLASASNYDSKNPNLITRLIPPHMLLEGQWAQGLRTEMGDIGKKIGGNSIPGSAKIGSAQYLIAFLLVWAKFYDEMKIFVDHFSKVLTVDYDSNDSVAQKFLPFVGKYYGFDLPNIFSNVDPLQFIDGNDIQGTYDSHSNSLKFVQGEIWKRILINLNEITKSKGTIYSVKSLLRSAGIDPDEIFNIREYGGPTKRSLAGRRESRKEVSTSLDFSGSLTSSPSSISPQGFGNNIPIVISPYLTASRFEIGYPEPLGTMVSKNRHPIHGISNNRNDGLLTSGSFTYEGIYQFESNKIYPDRQSLVRFNVTGSASPASKTGIVANLIVLSGTQNSMTSSGSEIRLYARPDRTTSGKTLKLFLTGVDIFDGNLWSVSFGRYRSDDKIPSKSTKYLSEKVSSIGSSSYFLRCSRQSHGKIRELFVTSAFFKESSTAASNMFQTRNTTTNASGSFIIIGSQSLGGTNRASSAFLNSSTTDAAAKTTKFAGQVSQIRFWSKALEEESWLEHVRNFKSLGVEDPLTNFNFETNPTGAFGRMRVNASTDQRTTGSDSSGRIRVFDFSQNGYHLTGSGFEPLKSVIKSETFYYSQLSPFFDLSETDNKVRVRSYQSPEQISLSGYATSAPSYEVRKSEEPDDDTRFRIEMSAVKGLNDDIMRMFGTLEFFDQALGAPNLIFDDFYPDLDQARKIYFKRLKEKPDLQIFFTMFKWFDTAYGELLSQLIPKKTKFLGVNFVLESHTLERSRFRYLFDEIYLKALSRDVSRGNLTLSQIVGNLKKY